MISARQQRVAFDFAIAEQASQCGKCVAEANIKPMLLGQVKEFIGQFLGDVAYHGFSKSIRRLFPARHHHSECIECVCILATCNQDPQQSLQSSRTCHNASRALRQNRLSTRRGAQQQRMGATVEVRFQRVDNRVLNGFRAKSEAPSQTSQCVVVPQGNKLRRGQHVLFAFAKHVSQPPFMLRRQVLRKIAVGAHSPVASARSRIPPRMGETNGNFSRNTLPTGVNRLHGGDKTTEPRVTVPQIQVCRLHDSRRDRRRRRAQPFQNLRRRLINLS